MALIPFAVLAVAGVALITVGACLWWLPGGLMVGGVLLIFAAYIGVYLRTRLKR